MNRKGHNAALTEVFSSAPSLPPTHKSAEEVSAKLRQLSYDGGLWFLLGWDTCKDIAGRWYIDMTITNGRQTISLVEDPLWFQQTLLPSLPWVELVPAPPKPMSVLLGAQARRMAR